MGRGQFDAGVNGLTIFYVLILQPFFSSKSQSLAFRKERNDKSLNADSKNTFNVLGSCCPLKKNLLSNVCLGFFGIDNVCMPLW